MGINFPSIPITGQIFNAAPGVSYIYSGIAWNKAPMITALSKNYIVNSAMQISQENGAAVQTAYGAYPVDQWRFLISGITGWTVLSESADLHRLALRVTVAKPSLAASDFIGLSHEIEGIRVRDLAYGIASAKQAIFRLSVYVDVPAAGTYSIAIRNGSNTRAFLASFTAVGGAWETKSFVIPGDITGTWLIDSGVGVKIQIVFACGTTYQGIAGWQTGDKLGLTGMSNGAATINNTFYIKDVGLYLDPYLTGVAPEFEQPVYAHELRRCQRYWYPQFMLRGGVTSNATLMGWSGSIHPAPMRVAPTPGIIGTPRIYDGSVTGVITSLQGVSTNQYACQATVVCASGGFGAGRGAAQYYQDESHYIAMNARM